MATCDDHRLSLSASADGELDARDEAALSAHLVDCADCRAYATELVELDRLVATAGRTPAPDLTREVLLAVDLPLPAPARRDQLRGFLALVAIVQLILAIPVIAGLATHVARDLAVSELALAGALLYAAWRPSAALGLLPFAGLLAVGGIGTAVLDAVSGSASLAAELVHLLPVASVVPLWQLSREAAPATGLRQVRA